MTITRSSAAVFTAILLVGLIYWTQSSQKVEQGRTPNAAGEPMARSQESRILLPRSESEMKAGGVEIGSARANEKASARMREQQAMTANAASMLPHQSIARSKGEVPAKAFRVIDDVLAAEPVLADEPVGIRLAHDVRLPAAALPLDFKMSPVAEKMLKEIVDDYYRELAATVASAPEGDEIQSGDEGPTVLVSNGPIVDEARKRADYRFRALFGNAAYNRITMNSVLESRLPGGQNSGSGPAIGK